MQAYQEKEHFVLTRKNVVFVQNSVTTPAVMVDPHWHDAYEVLYVRQGCGEQQINAQTFPYAPGTVTVICPGDVHSTTATSPEGSLIDVLQFNPEYFCGRDAFLLTLSSFVVDTTDKAISDLFGTLPRFAANETPSGDLLLSGTVFLLCGFLLEYCKNAAPLVRMTKFSREVCDYLRNANDLSLSTISQYFGYSREHFSRRFHAELGISYQHYCEKTQMKRIRKVLDEPSVPLGELAERFGFSNSSSMNRAFKRIYGISPSVYRKLKNQSHE